MGYKKSPTGRRSGYKQKYGTSRASGLQKQGSISFPDVQAFRRFCVDAYLILSLFPAKMRYSYYVDSKGRLRCRADRRAGS